MRTIFETAYAKASDLQRAAKEAVVYITKNKSIMLSEHEKIDLMKMKTNQSTPIVDQYNKIINNTKVNDFAIMDVSRAPDGVPTCLTIDENSLNGKWVTNAPEGLQKPWINISGLLSHDKRNQRLSDIARFMGLIIRGRYCELYSQKSVWISPALAVFIIETYSLAARLRIVRMFNLDAEEGNLVQTAFAYHYAKLLGPIEDQTKTNKTPPLMSRCGFLGSYSEISSRIEHMHEAAGGDFYKDGLRSLCDTLSNVGPGRMNRKFSVELFYRIFSIGLVDNVTMSYSVDYPPYWLFMMMGYAAGSKNGLMNSIFSINVMKKKLSPFIDKLITNRGFLEE